MMPNAFQRTMQRVAKGLFGISFGTPGADSWAFAQQWVRGFYEDGGADGKPYENVGPYCRAVSVIARDAASVPWEFFTVQANGEPSDEPVDNHPVLRVWQKPNSDTLGNQLMIGSYLCKLVFGEWIWYYPDLRLGGNGGLRATGTHQGEILLLHPPSVIRRMEGNEIVYSMRDATGTERRLDRRFLTVSKRYNPHDPMHGMSLAASIMADMIGYRAAAEWNARFFNEQNGIPSGLLKPGTGNLLDASTKAGRDQRMELMRTWNQRHGGKRRSVGLLPGPEWDFIDLGINQRDMDFAELRQFGRDEILAAAGVPPLIAGYLTRPITYNASEQKEVYWESTINSFVVEEQAVINFDFLPKIGVTERVWPKWEVVAALLENLGEKTDVAVKWFGMGLSKRVINERLDMGWDEEQIPDYDVGYLPFSVVPQSLVNEPPEPMDDNGDDDSEATDDAEERPQRRLRVVSIAGGTEERRALVWRSIVNRVRDIEAAFNKAIRRHFVEIREEVDANLDGMKGWQIVHARRKELVTSVFDVDAAKKKLQKATASLQKRSVVRGAEALLAEIAVAVAFDLESPRVIAMLAELSHKITRIDDTIERLLSSSLSEGFTANETLEQLRDRVAQVMDASLGRSLTIARTETGFAYNGGRFEAMKQAGVKRHEWLSSRDPDVRESHYFVDGEQVALGEPFSNGLLYPQDPSGPASEVVNCRCTPVAVEV